MTRIKVVAMSFAFICALSIDAAAGPGGERLWLEAQNSFYNASHEVASLRAIANPLQPAKPYLKGKPAKSEFFSVESVFKDEYRVTGPKADLTIRRALVGPSYIVRYDITGRFFGREFSIAQPLVVRKESFGSSIRIFIEGPEVNVVFDRVSGWKDVRVDMSVGKGLQPEFSLLFSSLFSMLPGFGMSQVAAAAQAPALPPQEGALLSYRMTAGSLSKYVQGANIDLRIDQRPWGRNTIYEASGSAFGREFGFGSEQWVLETDRDFLGPTGYRLRGNGIDLEVRDGSFGGRSRLEYSGTVKESPDFAMFSFTLVNFIFAR